MPEPPITKKLANVPGKGLVLSSSLDDKDFQHMTLRCTSCGNTLSHNPSQVKKHKHLGVLVCKKCHDFYGDGDFSQDEDGDNYCRWCAEGGKLIGCDNCSNAYCEGCIHRNFGRTEKKKINQQTSWKCYVCNPSSIENHVVYCDLVLAYIKRQNTKPNEKTRKTKSVKRSTIERTINDEEGDVSSSGSSSSESGKKCWLNVHLDRATHTVESFHRTAKKLKFKVGQSVAVERRVLRGANRLVLLLSHHIVEVNKIMEDLGKELGEHEEKIQTVVDPNSVDLSTTILPLDESTVPEAMESQSLLDGVNMVNGFAACSSPISKGPKDGNVKKDNKKVQENKNFDGGNTSHDKSVKSGDGEVPSTSGRVSAEEGNSPETSQKDSRKEGSKGQSSKPLVDDSNSQDEDNSLGTKQKHSQRVSAEEGNSAETSQKDSRKEGSKRQASRPLVNDSNSQGEDNSLGTREKRGKKKRHSKCFVDEDSSSQDESASSRNDSREHKKNKKNRRSKVIDGDVAMPSDDPVSESNSKDSVQSKLFFDGSSSQDESTNTKKDPGSSKKRASNCGEEKNTSFKAHKKADTESSPKKNESLEKEEKKDAFNSQSGNDEEEPEPFNDLDETVRLQLDETIPLANHNETNEDSSSSNSSLIKRPGKSKKKKGKKQPVESDDESAKSQAESLSKIDENLKKLRSLISTDSGQSADESENFLNTSILGESKKSNPAGKKTKDSTKIHKEESLNETDTVPNAFDEIVEEEEITKPTRLNKKKNKDSVDVSQDQSKVETDIVPNTSDEMVYETEEEIDQPPDKKKGKALASDDGSKATTNLNSAGLKAKRSDSDVLDANEFSNDSKYALANDDNLEKSAKVRARLSATYRKKHGSPSSKSSRSSSSTPEKEINNVDKPDVSHAKKHINDDLKMDADNSILKEAEQEKQEREEDEEDPIPKQKSLGLNNENTDKLKSSGDRNKSDNMDANEQAKLDLLNDSSSPEDEDDHIKSKSKTCKTVFDSNDDSSLRKSKRTVKTEKKKAQSSSEDDADIKVPRPRRRKSRTQNFSIENDQKLVTLPVVGLRKLDKKTISMWLNGEIKDCKGRRRFADIDKEIRKLETLPSFWSRGPRSAKKRNKRSVAMPPIQDKKTQPQTINFSDLSDDSDPEQVDVKTEKTAPSDQKDPKSINDVAKDALLKELADDSSEADSDIEIISSNLNKTAKKSKPSKKRTKGESGDSSSDDFVVTKKKSRYEKVLAMKLDSDSESSNTRMKKRREATEASKKRSRKRVIDSDNSGKKTASENSSGSESDEPRPKKTKKRKRIKTLSSNDEDASGDEKKDLGDTPTGKGRKNIRKVLGKTDLDKETKKAAAVEKERRKRVADRQKRYNQVTEKVGDKGDVITRKLTLEVHKESKEELVEVPPELLEKLKPHQVNGVKFMWECVIESLERLEDKKGSGCVLAHCMGLGKTLQVITFITTLLKNDLINKHIKTALVVCPFNTVLNWEHEFEHWLDTEDLQLNVWEMSSVKNYDDRFYYLKRWKEEGGVMIMSYDMFRTLSQAKAKTIPKKRKEKFHALLNDPGPDLVVCDEGHILKNATTAIAKAMSTIRTGRRIVLTGTPLQNNLKEYHCMVHFVKPHLIGSAKEFLNRFVNPISNGQCADSTPSDVKLMKKRVHILHKLLEGCVQRCDYSHVAKYLPPKHEYVISVRLSEAQIKLYSHYLDNFARKSGTGGAGTDLFKDFSVLRLIWTHPHIMQLNQTKKDNKEMFDDRSDADEVGSLADFINDNSNSSDGTSGEDVVCLDAAGPSKPKEKKTSDSDSGSVRSTSSREEVISKWKSRTRGAAKETGKEPEFVTLEDIPRSRGTLWWQKLVPEDQIETIELGGKIVLLLDILRECSTIGDKVLVFSQSLLTLDLIEIMLGKDESLNGINLNGPSDLLKANPTAEDRMDSSTHQDIMTSWTLGLDYFRMDGSTSADYRKRWIDIFNTKENERARLFLISTKAGSLGTNLIGANRVVLMDASWNPTHDVQAIFRVFRFGQVKPVYIYRFLSQGTMEEKIYDRQVAKQSLACRVVDEQQPERHFSAADLQELYQFNPESKSNRPTPVLPKDRLMAELLIRHKDWIVTYHEHDSLLQEDKEDDLTEEERQVAWTEYEQEREGINQATNELKFQGMAAGGGLGPDFPPGAGMGAGHMPQGAINIYETLKNIRARYPNIGLNSLMQIVQNYKVHQRTAYMKLNQLIQDCQKNQQIIPPGWIEQLKQLAASVNNCRSAFRVLEIQRTQLLNVQRQNLQQQQQANAEAYAARNYGHAAKMATQTANRQTLQETSRLAELMRNRNITIIPKPSPSYNVQTPSAPTKKAKVTRLPGGVVISEVPPGSSGPSTNGESIPIIEEID